MDKIRKKIFHFIIITLAIGCDYVDPPLVSTDDYAYQSDLYGAPPSFVNDAAPIQKVLLEDFTGQDCGNCPNGHNIAANLLLDHEENLAVIAVHAGSLAVPFLPDYPNDWTTPEGIYYHSQLGEDLLPTGRINRNGGVVPHYGISRWTDSVNVEFTRTPLMNLQMVAEYVPEAQHLNVHTYSQWFTSAAGSYNLVLLITQSHIIAPQLWYGAQPLEYISNYEHNHMLRASLTGAEGRLIAVNPAPTATVAKSYTFDWNTALNPNNCEIVAFVVNNTTGEIMNVAKVKVIE
jgi:Outer membrane protein Omp28